jgi:hypothetical protein
MKKIVLFLFAILVISNCGFSQNNEAPKFDSKEDAIKALKENYLYMYFKNPEDTIANIDRFIDEVNKIVPFDNEKRINIKASILSEIKQTEKSMTVNHVLGLNTYNIPNFIPVMGINVNDILKSSFSSSDYEKIHDGILKDRINTRFAYNYLSQLYKEKKGKEGIIFVTYGNPRIFLDEMFNYYRILD